MQSEKTAELATQIVVAALQSGKIEVKAENIAVFYATIFAQIIASEKAAQPDDSSHKSIDLPRIGM